MPLCDAAAHYCDGEPEGTTMSDSNQPAGWYPGEGDPPGTNRWWDGEMWVGDPVPAAPAAPSAGGPQAFRTYPEKSEAVTALVLGILGFVACQLLSPFAWQIGKRELEAMDAGRRDPKDRSMATAGKVLGIVGTVIMGLMLIGLVFFLIFAVAASSSGV